MFKPLPVLQATFLLVLTSGCATTTTLDPARVSRAAQTEHTGPATGSSTPQTTGKAPVPSVAPGSMSTPAPQVDMAAIEHAPPIQAGSSVAQPGPLLNPDGTLPPTLRDYANDVARSRQVPLTHVESLLGTIRFNEQAYRLMSPGKTRLRRSWVTYRNRFVEPIRIQAGTRFWQENKTALDKAASTYGVPASILVAIIGVETIYGRYTGSFRVLDALATLGFRYPDASRPERSQLFRDQLADLIQLDYQGKLNAREATGSFAGAMGLPQFMPGSLLRYAADGDNDGRINLLESTDDAVNSVARFLRLHGWVPGLPVFAPAQLPANPAALVTGGLEPTWSWEELQAKGVQAAPDARKGTQNNKTATTYGTPGWTQYKLGVIDLVDEPRNLNEYRVATPNFFAITHYNRSYFYAASVAELARELAQRMGQAAPF